MNICSSSWLKKNNKDKDDKVCRLRGLTDPTARGNVIAYRFLQNIPDNRQVRYNASVDWKRGEDVVLLEAFTGRDVSTVDFEGIIQSSDPSAFAALICGSNEYVPIYGLFQSVGGISNLLLSYLQYVPGFGGTVAGLSDFGLSLISMRIENKWTGPAGSEVALGTVQFTVRNSNEISKLITDLTLKFGKGTKFLLPLKNVTKLSTGTTRNTMIAADMGLKVTDLLNLASAMQEVKSGSKSKELKSACTAAYK